MQPTDLFSISTLIDQVHTWAVVWMPNILPWMAFFLGITLVFIIARGIIDYISNRADSAFSKDLDYEAMEDMGEEEMFEYLDAHESPFVKTQKKSHRRILEDDIYYDLHEHKMKKRNRGMVDTFLLK